MFVGWRDMMHAKGRFVLMTGVVMMVAVLVGLLSGLTSGLAHESTSAITGLETERLVFSGDSPDFASSRIPASAGIDGVPIGLSTSRLATGESTTPVTAIGVPVGSSVAADAGGVADGEVILSRPLAEELSVTSGDVLQLGGEPFEVSAVRGDASYSHLPVVWTSLGDWHQVTGAEHPTVVATGDVEVPGGYTSLSLDDSLSAIGSFQSENGSLQLIRGFLFAISALVVGAFFTVWTVQRFGDIAVLKALGASTGWLLRDAMGQAALLLSIGVGLAGVVVVLASFLVGDAVPFVLSATTVGAPMLVLVLLGLAGAALAVRRVTTVDPLTALGSAR